MRHHCLLHHAPLPCLTLVSAVSQFTLLASTKKGNKPDFHKSAPAAKGKELYDHFIRHVQSGYREDRVKDGVFQAMMDVGLINDGPVGVDYRCIDEAVSPRCVAARVSYSGALPRSWRATQLILCVGHY